MYSIKFIVTLFSENFEFVRRPRKLSSREYFLIYSKWKRYCTICEAKTKMLISCAVTAKLICVFGFVHLYMQTVDFFVCGFIWLRPRFDKLRCVYMFMIVQVPGQCFYI